MAHGDDDDRIESEMMSEWEDWCVCDMLKNNSLDNSCFLFYFV